MIIPTPSGMIPARVKVRRAVLAERKKFILFGVGAAALLWASWATHSILAVRKEATPLVKVQLAELLRGYVQAEARSGVPADQMTAQTGQFLKVMNDAVSAHARSGQVVLLSNAVVDGNIPDITDEVRAQIYAHVPRPQTGPAAAAAAVEAQQLFGSTAPTDALLGSAGSPDATAH